MIPNDPLSLKLPSYKNSPHTQHHPLVPASSSTTCTPFIDVNATTLASDLTFSDTVGFFATLALVATLFSPPLKKEFIFKILLI
jgi:hypothetical protein